VSPTGRSDIEVSRRTIGTFLLLSLILSCPSLKPVRAMTYKPWQRNIICCIMENHPEDDFGNPSEWKWIGEWKYVPFITEYITRWCEGKLYVRGHLVLIWVGLTLQDGTILAEFQYEYFGLPTEDL
jgi:hypothetical protein